MNDTPTWEGPGLDAWEAWTPQQASALLKGVDAPWCVVGGWAIDLFLGRTTREHADLEIAIPRTSLPAMRTHLTGYRLYAVGDGEVRRLGAVAPLPDDKHQCWVLDEEAGKWRMDVMSEPGDALKWVCRRDERINAPREWMVGTSDDGIPFLVPEAVLLFKAKYCREKDEADFAACLPELTAPAKD
ncbi:MAG TPA: hypothetical protein VHL34_11665, partial [Rhizomicrobium sp.]|nr:hypothetical protein [Rhizomicrobium sp.]